MHVRSLDRSSTKIEYGVPSQRNFPWVGVTDPPFGSMWLIVAPGEQTDIDQHVEPEALVIVSGHGTMRVGTDIQAVSANDIVYIPAGAEHTVRNDGADELLGLGIWWDGESVA
ncbi:MAG: hypothetical protein QOK43_338 [Acidimicrobiaceae bacterium]|nr:hypothetical protein [Acidimicrobiaceae bacterium]